MVQLCIDQPRKIFVKLHKPKDDLFHLLNLICLKYTGQYLPSDCEPTNGWKYVTVDGKRRGIQPKLTPRSVMDYCVFNPLALQIKRQLVTDELLYRFGNSRLKTAFVTKYPYLTDYCNIGFSGRLRSDSITKMLGVLYHHRPWDLNSQSIRMIREIDTESWKYQTRNNFGKATRYRQDDSSYGLKYRHCHVEHCFHDCMSDWSCQREQPIKKKKNIWNALDYQLAYGHHCARYAGSSHEFDLSNPYKFWNERDSNQSRKWRHQWWEQKKKDTSLLHNTNTLMVNLGLMKRPNPRETVVSKMEEYWC
jgi:hypothetical protein